MENTNYWKMKLPTLWAGSFTQGYGDRPLVEDLTALCSQERNDQFPQVNNQLFFKRWIQAKGDLDVPLRSCLIHEVGFDVFIQSVPQILQFESR